MKPQKVKLLRFCSESHHSITQYCLISGNGSFLILKYNCIHDMKLVAQRENCNYRKKGIFIFHQIR